jgi:Helix-turn-helix domain
MGEENSHLHEFDDPDGMKPQELAAMRWQAIEAFNGVVGISPMARRLGIKLISCMDAKTRRCYPGEARVAAELGVHLSAIKKAKAELKDAGLLTWFNPGGPRHLSHYSFNWAALLRYSGEARERGNRAVTTNITKRRQGTHTGTNGVPFNSTHTGTNQRDVNVTSERANSTQNEFQGTQIEVQGTHTGTPIVPTRAPDTTLDIALKDIAQHITPSQANGGLGCAEDLDRPFLSHPSASELSEPKRALEKRGVALPTLCPNPELLEALADPKLTAALCKVSDDIQFKASELLKTKGLEIARAYVVEKTTPTKSGLKVIDDAFGTEPGIIAAFLKLGMNTQGPITRTLSQKGPEAARTLILSRSNGVAA